MPQPKILLLDIETAPNEVYMWDMYQEWTSTEMLKKPWYILCWCAKWLDSPEIMSSALVDFPSAYRRNKKNEKGILKAMRKLLSEADILVGHNIIGFDIGKLRAKFLRYKIPLPPPAKLVDTLLVARKQFKFSSNKLGDLAEYLNIGQKIETGGIKLWTGCMAGNLDDWLHMVEYCKHDVTLLEGVYRRFLPSIDNHPNVGIYLDSESPVCPKCGSVDLVKYGFTICNQTRYQRFQCKGCGGYARSRIKEIQKGPVQVVNIT